MRSGLSRRVVNLELRATRDALGPVTVRSFLAQVEERMRLTRERFQDAVQALVVRLRDDELEAMLLEAESPNKSKGSLG